MPEFSTINELLEAARATIPEPFVDFVFAGTGSEETLRRNRVAFERLAIEQGFLFGSEAPDISTTFLGSDFGAPLLTAPMGVVRDVGPEAEVDMVRGAGLAGCGSTVANGAERPLGELAAAATGPLLAQVVCTTEPARLADKIEHANAGAPFRAVCITVDGHAEGRLDGYVEAHPERSGGEVKSLIQPANPYTWAEIEQIRERLSVPMGLKGIMSGLDARAAVDHGADFVWVSNHGGRKFDSVRATIDVLEDVVEAVGSEVPIVVDSGFRRGSDVLKALAMGATLVALGRLSISAVAVGGAKGVTAMFELMKGELANALACTGRRSIAELSPEVLRRVDY